MKTVILFLIILTTTIHVNSSAQAQWVLNGQNTLGESIGTTNGQPFTIITFGSPRLTVDAGGDVGIGTTTPTELLDVNGNINIANTNFYSINGVRQLFTVGTTNLLVGNSGNATFTGTNNVAVGPSAGTALTTGNENTFTGFQSGQNNTEGSCNTFYGQNSGRENDEGNDNSFFGRQSGFNNVGGSRNSFFGVNTGFENVGGERNSYFGTQSGEANVSGSRNTYFGSETGMFMTTGDDNVLIGERAMRTAAGSDNVVIGSNAGNDAGLDEGDELVLIGFDAEAADGLRNSGAIGAHARVTENNCLVLGSIGGVNGAAASANVGIGLTDPAFTLDVDGGDINLADQTRFIRVEGDEAFHMDAVNNLAIGMRHDLSTVTTANRNVMIGNNTGVSLTEGRFNCFVGFRSGEDVTEADRNSFFGECSGRQTSTGQMNSFFGAFSGEDVTTGSSNTFVGNGSAQQITTGSFNLICGNAAGNDLTTDDNNDGNVILGAQAGTAGPVGMETATEVTLVGFDTEADNELSNAGAIGSHAYVTASNSLILGGITDINDGTNTNVGIGLTAPKARLDVVNNAMSVTGNFNCVYQDMTDIISANYVQASSGDIDGIDVNLATTTTTGSFDNVGVRSLVDSDGDSHTNYGVLANATGSTNYSYGVQGICEEALLKNVGVFGEAKSNSISRDYGLYGVVTSGSTSGSAYGIYAEASTSSGNNYGGEFKASGNAVTNYGIYANATGATTNWAGYFIGNVHATGTVTWASDSRLKDQVEDLHGLDILMQLSPKAYTYNNDKLDFLNLPEEKSYGVIAQELQEVLPELVHKTVYPAQFGPDGDVASEEYEYLSVNYIGLIPFTVSAIQEQQKIIELQTAELEAKEERISELESEIAILQELVTEVAGLKAEMEELAAMQNDASHRQTVTEVPNQGLDDNTELFQNRPNPFRADTEISYNLGKGGLVDLSIYNMDGRLIINLVDGYENSGSHTVMWRNNDVPNGIYFYILTVDGVEYVKRAIRLD